MDNLYVPYFLSSADVYGYAGKTGLHKDNHLKSCAFCIRICYPGYDCIAFFVPGTGSGPTESPIKDTKNPVKRTPAPYKYLRDIEIVPDLLKNPVR